MAIIDVNHAIHRALVQFEAPLPEACNASTEVLFVGRNAASEQVYFRIPVRHVQTAAGGCFVTVAFPEKIVAIAMSNYGEGQVGFLIDGAYRHAERITLSTQVLRGAVDPLKLNTQHVKLPEKPGRVAVFTQAYNEGAMLLYWERFYGRLVGHENLYVLDNASDDGACARLNPKTSVIHMPKAPVDHDHFAQAHGYFQRFLLLKYDWVVKVDTDELLACEGGLVETLARTPPGSYTPETGVEVVHDTAVEAAFDFAGSVGAQRRRFVRASQALIRPIVSSQPTTWTSGNHQSHEGAIPLPGLYAVHLRCFDLDFLLSKNKKWSAMTQTLNERNTCAMISELNGLGLRELYDLSVKEIDKHLGDEPLDLPDWFAASI
jgi:hypothetical protein